MTYTTFFGRPRKATNLETSSLEITIDSKVVKYLGLEPGDQVKVMIKKVEEEEDVDKNI